MIYCALLLTLHVQDPQVLWESQAELIASLNSPVAYAISVTMIHGPGDEIQVLADGCLDLQETFGGIERGSLSHSVDQLASVVDVLADRVGQSDTGVRAMTSEWNIVHGRDRAMAYSNPPGVRGDLLRTPQFFLRDDLDNHQVSLTANSSELIWTPPEILTPLPIRERDQEWTRQHCQYAVETLTSGGLLLKAESDGGQVISTLFQGSKCMPEACSMAGQGGVNFVAIEYDVVQPENQLYMRRVVRLRRDSQGIVHIIMYSMSDVRFSLSAEDRLFMIDHGSRLFDFRRQVTKYRGVGSSGWPEKVASSTRRGSKR